MISQPFNPRPVLAGTYFDWESDVKIGLPAVIGNTVAVPGTSDWGPVNTVEELSSFAEYQQIFGDSLSPLAIAVYNAFLGEGLNGQGGAGTVLAERMATNSAAPATLVLHNTTPAVALTLTGLYPGTRANNLSATVQPGVQSGTDDLLILDGETVVETYTYNTTDIADLAVQINLFSNWVSAVEAITGVGLTVVSDQPFTGGLDGNSLLAADWTAMFAAFDQQRWSIFAPFDLTSSSILASAEAWIQNRNNLGTRCMAVFGSGPSDTLPDAITRSEGLNDWDTVCLGDGLMYDSVLQVQLSTSQLASRVAGAIAARGEVRDLIYARFVNLTMVSAPPSLADQTQALQAGLTVFCKDTNVQAPVFIKEGVTSYFNDAASPVDSQGNKTRPVAFYKRIKNVRIQQGVEQDTSDWATSGNVLGSFPVNAKTRGLVLGYIKTLYANREAASIVQSGWTVILDPSVPSSDDDDFVQYLHGFHPSRSLRQILNVARVG